MPVAADGTVKCIDCAHFRLKDAGQIGKHGFGLCAASHDTSSFPSLEHPRQCAKFVLDAVETLATRYAWLEKRGEG